ncbi:MAG TPA: hypothetical protein VMF29_08780 [Candidatus Edwardsbacteria bacterium]|nr:hypothetical protein [Candidatus Edwardsbacteria bacterium]
MTRWFAILVLAVLSAAAAPAGGAAGPIAGHDSTALSGRDGQRSYPLGRRYIFAGTDSLFKSGRLLRRDDEYAINDATGEVYFSEPLTAGDTVVALFRALAIDLPPAIIYLPLVTVDTAARSADTAAASRRPPGVVYLARDSQEAAASAGSQVRFGGSKTFSIAAGSGRDLSLDQALNVNADGRLSPDLEISASLSDRNLPLTQAGTTEELSQLDRMSIQARASNWSVALGDFDLAYPEMSLLRLDRQLQGVRAEGRAGGGSLAGAYSLSKGKTEVNRIAGQEGKQGPYKLAVGGGAAVFTVLANSQRVWLDGELLRPGASNDYTMDFDRAELTFTPRRPITRDSRIVVEFQYATDGFRRSLYFADAGFAAGDHVTLRAAYLQESDDPDRPSGAALSDSQRAAIARAGGDTALLWVDGGTRVDSGSGSYVKPDTIYVFVGPGRGNYDVAFTAAGTAAGDYDFDNALGGYRYVGRGIGSYAARRRLVSPQSQQVAGLRADLRWAGGTAFAEGSGSQVDANTLAPGRAASSGTAGRAHLQWQRDTLGWGGFRIRSDLSSLSRTYSNINMAREPGFEAAWGLRDWAGLRPADPLSPHRAFDLDAAYSLFSYATIGGGWGRLEFLDGRWARAYRLASGLTLPGAPQLRYQRSRYLLGNAWADAAGGSGQRDRNDVTSAWSRGPWQLNGGFLHNVDRRDAGPDRSLGTRYWEASLGWARHTALLSLGQTLQRRDDGARDSLSGAWSGQSYTTTVNSTVRLSKPRRLNVALDHSFRRLTVRPGAVGQDLTSHLAALHVDHNGLRQMLRTSFDYTISAVEAAQTQERYYRVADRTGNYSYDTLSGTFYPDTAGSYDRTLVDLAGTQRATENAAKGSLTIEPSSLPGAWKGLRLDGVASAAIKSPQALDLKQLSFQRDRLWRAANVSSRLDLAGDLSYAAAAGWNGSLHLRWKRDNDNQIQGRHLDSRAVERRGDLFLPLSPQWRAALVMEYNTSSAASAEYGLESGIATLHGSCDAGCQIDPALELAGKGDAVRERLERLANNPLATAVAFTTYTVTPYLTRQLGTSGRARAEAGIIARSADRDREQIPAEFAVTRPLGLTKTWALQFDYRINTVLTSSAGYDGRKEPDKQPVHNARLELRAYF